VRVIVDQSEDIGRVGFAGLLAETEAPPPIAAESPEAWAPVGVSSGAVEHAQRQAVEAFCLWLDGQRHERRS
jgi:hypothetical protein